MQITEILKQCTVHGMTVRLPAGQLERNDYLEVKKALELISENTTPTSKANKSKQQKYTQLQLSF